MQSIFTLILLCTLIFSVNCSADDGISPSFDCKKATTVVEKNICNDKDLADLDRKLAAAFFELKNNPQDRLNVSVEDLIKNQKEWLKNRGNDNCLDECLKKKYQQRLVELSFPGAPIPLSNEKVKELENFFKDKDCESFEPINAVGLDNANHIMKTDGLDEFACKIYEINPAMGNKLFSGCYGSGRDNFIPRCDFSTIIKQVDGLKDFTDLLRFLYLPNTNQSGTMIFGEINTQNSAIMTAIYDLNVPTSTEKATDPLLYFSLQGIWEKEQYKKYVQLKEKAQRGLEKYYLEVKKIPLDQAKKAAEFQINNLNQVYINSHIKHDSHYWGLKEVDNFLKSGIIPDNDGLSYSIPDDVEVDVIEHLEQQSKEEAKPEILAYLLKLAVVNDYSKQDIEKIIAAGANLKNPKLTDDALMNAVQRPDIMRLLIDKGANVNAQNYFGKTALMYAIQYGSLEAVKILVDHKADVNLATIEQPAEQPQLSAYKRTPLMYAAWHANDEVVKYLLAKGAKVDAKDSNGHDYKFYLTKNDYIKTG